MSKPYVIRVSSQKGGVGKTTVSVNLAIALSLAGSKTLLIDADFINPSVGIHLGVEGANVGVRAVLIGKSSLEGAVVRHNPSGLDVLPGEIVSRPHNPTAAQMQRLFRQIFKTTYNFVIVDTPPGFFPEEEFGNFGEAIIITTPEMSSCVSAVRLANDYDRTRLKHELLINKFRNKGYELHVKEIEEMYDGTILAILPDSEIVPIGVSERIPAYLMNRRAPFSSAIGELAEKYITKAGFEFQPKKSNSIFARIAAAFRLLFGRN
ncbi:MAG: AAA family ATPase [Candidatus Micrarchaeota archaeon]|nr:AAA family ATPase [Candidatus Micrarchaeota archaeon]